MERIPPGPRGGRAPVHPGQSFLRNNVPTLPTLERICQALGITLQEFFTEQPTLPSENAMTESLLEQWKDLSPAQKSLVLELMRQLRRP